MSFDTFVGWDIGGAHLKVASVDRDGVLNGVRRLATPIWRGLDHLERALSSVRDQIEHDAAVHNVTMTAELVDIFRDRATGVYELNACLGVYFKDQPYYLYAGDRGLIDPREVSRHARAIASANWHATGSFVAQCLDKGIVVDIGSTTTDLIPFCGGKLHVIGYTDHQRLRHDELVYTGVIRTPVMSIVNRLFYQGRWQNIAAEHFATMADVYRLTGKLDERDDLIAAVDGAGKAVGDSARRLFRMLGLDYLHARDLHDAREIAGHIAEAQLDRINASLVNVLARSTMDRPTCLVGAGAGFFLVQQLARRHQLRTLRFTDFLRGGSVSLDAHDHRILSAATAISAAQIARLKHWRSN